MRSLTASPTWVWQSSTYFMQEVTLPFGGMLYSRKNSSSSGTTSSGSEKLQTSPPHIFGPYSEAAEVALGELVSLGLVRRSGGGYTLTPDGVRVWEKVCSVFNTEESGAIEDLKAFLNDLSVDEVLLFVYITYPEYTHESARLRDILQKRVPLSASLYRKGKVSLEKAAFLAGMDIESYLDYLKRLLQIVNMQQQCLEAEALRGIINESGDASLDYFSSKKNIVKGDLKGLARRGGR